MNGVAHAGTFASCSLFVVTPGGVGISAGRVFVGKSEPGTEKETGNG